MISFPELIFRAYSITGDCKVVLEIAGPAASATPAVIIAPDDIRGMAFWLMENCVRDSHLGGYVTRGLARLTNYVRDNPSDLVDPHWRMITTPKLTVC